MKLTAVPALQLSARSTIRPGDKVKLSGGPRYKAARIGQPGSYRIRRILKSRQRYWIEADRIDRDGLSAGTFTLYVAGPAFRSKLVASILNRPYRVRKARQ
jgi:uncharacterized protein YjhX (UPF0386 family)